MEDLITLERATNQSVEKAIGVLGAFADGQALRVADVANYVGLGQSTASRLLSTLESLDLVERDAVSNLYKLGPELVTLAGVALNQHPVHRAARQTAQNLAAQIGLGVNVAVRRDSTLFYLCHFEGVYAPKSYTLLGQRNPLNATGIGKCLLLAVPTAERAELLGELSKFTSSTIGNLDDLNAEIERVSARGYSTEVEELALGRACIAAPILDQTRTVCAAISISGPLSAIALDRREAELATIVIETADGISSSLGYLGPKTHRSYLKCSD